jgi:Carboxypeptidase regulatory-like domain
LGRFSDENRTFPLARAGVFRDHRCRHRTTSSGRAGRGGSAGTGSPRGCTGISNTVRDPGRRPGESRRIARGGVCVANDRRVILALVALTCWLAPASPAAAQSMLGGVVRDPGGQVAANITVVAENEATGEISEARSSAIGLFAFYHLPPGNYTISVTHPSLTFYEERVRVAPRQKRALDIKLSFQETVTVRTPSPLPRRLTDGSLGFSYSREAIEGMFKSNGENLQSILGAINGINVTEFVGTHAQFTSIGQRRTTNSLTIDGVSADLAIDVIGLGISQSSSGALPAFATSGGTQTLVPFGAIDEVQIRTANAPSEYARSPGAQTAVVTRSGSDRFNASSFVNIRPDSLTAGDWFVNAGKRPPGRKAYRDISVSLGGPILPKRLFYFATWERQHIDRSVDATVKVPSLSLRTALENRPGGTSIRPLLDAYPLPNGGELPGGLAELTERFPVFTRSDAVSLRVDNNQSSRHRAFVRFNQGESEGDSLSQAYVPVYSFRSIESTSTTTATSGFSSVLGSVAHDLRTSWAVHRGFLDAAPSPLGNAQRLDTSELVAPGLSAGDAWVNITLPVDGGLVQAGRFTANSNRQFQIVDTWSILRGAHEWRAGLEYQQVTAFTNPSSHRYTYRFTNNAVEFVQGLARVVTIMDLLPARARRESYSLSIHDTFRATSALTLGFGLRYSVKPAPFSRTNLEPFLVDFDSLEPNQRPTPRGGPLWDTSWTDVAPRVNAAYQLGRSVGWETSVRTGWSLIFGERLSPGAGAFGGGYPYVATRDLISTPFPLPPDDLVSSPPVPLSDTDNSTYFSFPQDLRSPRTHEWQVALDQSLGRGQQLNLAYVGAAGRDLIYWHSFDVGSPTVQAYSNAARSDYHALLVEYVRRKSRGFQGRLSYTLSHAIDNDSGEARRPYAPPRFFSPSVNQASADFDRRHVLRVVGSYQIPASHLPAWLEPLCSGWFLDAVITAQSGTPVTINALPRTFSFGNYLVRPDHVSSVPSWIVDPESPGGRRINPAAFVGMGPLEVRQGTVGRNTLRSSPLRQIDASIARSIQIGQRVRAQMRLDVFNVLNTPNFGPPSGLWQSAGFGIPDRSFAEALGTGTLQFGGLVPIQQLGVPRSLQFGIRFSY